MGFIASLVIAVLLCLAVATPATATQEEADRIGALLEEWSDSESNPVESEAIAVKAVELFNSTTPDTACRVYADWIAVVMLLSDAIIDREAFIGAPAAFMIGLELPKAKANCIAEELAY